MEISRFAVVHISVHILESFEDGKMQTHIATRQKLTREGSLLELHFFHSFNSTMFLHMTKTIVFELKHSKN